MCSANDMPKDVGMGGSEHGKFGNMAGLYTADLPACDTTCEVASQPNGVQYDLSILSGAVKASDGSSCLQRVGSSLRWTRQPK